MNLSSLDCKLIAWWDFSSCNMKNIVKFLRSLTLHIKRQLNVNTNMFYRIHGYYRRGQIHTGHRQNVTLQSVVFTASSSGRYSGCWYQQFGRWNRYHPERYISIKNVHVHDKFIDHTSYRYILVVILSLITYCVFGGFNTFAGLSFMNVNLGSASTGMRYFTGALSSIFCKNSMSSPKGPDGAFGWADVGEFLQSQYIIYTNMSIRSIQFREITHTHQNQIYIILFYCY